MKVALVGLPYLQSRGLQAMIGESFPGWEVSIYDIGSHGWQDAQCHIVSAAAMASMARFLMPRLDRVLLVTSSAPASSPMPMLSPLASEQDVRVVLHELLSGIQSAQEHPGHHVPMTPREIEVLRLTAAGETSKQIADKLCISQNTVLTHRKNIAAKTGLHTVSAITHFAMVHGLLH